MSINKNQCVCTLSYSVPYVCNHYVTFVRYFYFCIQDKIFTEKNESASRTNLIKEMWNIIFVSHHFIAYNNSCSPELSLIQ